MIRRPQSLSVFLEAGIIVALTLTPSTEATAQDLSASTPVTFNKDVLPILQARCQVCHRPGEIAPMSLLTYTDARPWARAIKQAVTTREMPPWYAESGYVKLLNDPTLSDDEIGKFVAWADNGAVEGNPADKVPLRTFYDGWNIQPDMVIEMPEPVEIPAEGVVNYQNIRVDVDFPEDMWIAAAEMRAGDPTVVHHMRGNLIPTDSEVMKNAIPGVPYESGDEMLGEPDVRVDVLGRYNPSLGAQGFSLWDSAKFVPKGSNLVFNMHYTTSGKATTDRSKLGLVFAKEPPKKRFFS